MLRTTDTSPGTSPAPTGDVRPAELDGRLLTYDELRADRAVRLRAGDPDATTGVSR